MNDEQFNKLMAVQTAQLALLQGIYSIAQTTAAKEGIRGAGLNWDEAWTHVASASALLAKKAQLQHPGQAAGKP